MNKSLIKKWCKTETNTVRNQQDLVTKLVFTTVKTHIKLWLDQVFLLMTNVALC